MSWILVTENAVPENLPPNVAVATLPWERLVKLIRDCCGVSRGPEKPYRLCDYRFAFGDIFSDLLRGFSFWGFGDLDVVYGDLRSFLPERLFQHDLLTFNATHVSGHFTLLRNDPTVNTRYGESAVWRQNVERQGAQFLDEGNGFYNIAKVYAVESFNTPLSPYIPWVNGRFEFPAVWYYEDGRLLNNIDGQREFMYLHFMRYKARWNDLSRDRVIHFAGEMNRWKLRLDGFYPRQTGDTVSERGEVIHVAPARIS